MYTFLRINHPLLLPTECCPSIRFVSRRKLLPLWCVRLYVFLFRWWMPIFCFAGFRLVFVYNKFIFRIFYFTQIDNSVIPVDEQKINQLIQTVFLSFIVGVVVAYKTALFKLFEHFAHRSAICKSRSGNDFIAGQAFALFPKRFNDFYITVGLFEQRRLELRKLQSQNAIFLKIQIINILR